MNDPELSLFTRAGEAPVYAYCPRPATATANIDAEPIIVLIVVEPVYFLEVL